MSEAFKELLGNIHIDYGKDWTTCFQGMMVHLIIVCTHNHWLLPIYINKYLITFMEQIKDH